MKNCARHKVDVSLVYLIQYFSFLSISHLMNASARSYLSNQAFDQEMEYWKPSGFRSLFQVDFSRIERPSSTLQTTLQQNGDCQPSDVQLLKKRNIKPVKSSFKLTQKQLF